MIRHWFRVGPEVFTFGWNDYLKTYYLWIQKSSTDPPDILLGTKPNEIPTFEAFKSALASHLKVTPEIERRIDPVRLAPDVGQAYLILQVLNRKDGLFFVKRPDNKPPIPLAVSFRFRCP